MCLVSHVQLFVTPWSVAPQVPLSMAILQARILEWVVMPCSKGSSQPREDLPTLTEDSLPLSHQVSNYTTIKIN